MASWWCLAVITSKETTNSLTLTISGYSTTRNSSGTRFHAQEKCQVLAMVTRVICWGRGCSSSVARDRVTWSTKMCTSSTSSSGSGSLSTLSLMLQHQDLCMRQSSSGGRSSCMEVETTRRCSTTCGSSTLTHSSGCNHALRALVQPLAMAIHWRWRLTGDWSCLAVVRSMTPAEAFLATTMTYVS